MRRGLLTASALLAAAAAAAGAPASFFVAPTGSDSNDCTSPAAPCASLARACAAVAALPRPLPGDVTVSIDEGLYVLGARLDIDASCGGDDGGQVVFAGAGAGATVLSGGAPIPSWSVDTPVPGLWSAPAPPATAALAQLRSLYSTGGPDDDGASARRPLVETPVTPGATITGAPNGSASAVVLPAGGPGADAPPAAFEGAFLRIYHAWADSINAVAGYHPPTRTLTPSGALGDPYNPLSKGGGRYALQNLGVLTPAAVPPGSFHFSAATRTITYAPRPGEAPGGVALLAEALPVAVNITGSRVALLGLSVMHAAADLEAQCVYGRSGGCDAQGASDVQTAAVVVGGGAADVLLRGVEVAHVGGHGVGVGVGSARVVVDGGWVHHTGAGGVRLGGGAGAAPGAATADDVAVTNCELTDGGQLLAAGEGLLAQAVANATLAHNAVARFHNTGISVGWSWGFGPTPTRDVTVAANAVWDLGDAAPGGQPAATSDFGCIYSLGVFGGDGGLRVAGNVCHGVGQWAGGYGGWGLYLDEGTSNSVWEGNIVHSTSSASVHVHYGGNNTLVNNVLALSFQQPAACAGASFCDRSALLTDPGSEANWFSAERNVVWLAPNATAVDAGRGRGSLNATWGRNLYWSPSAGAAVAGQPGWAGGNFSAWRAAGRDGGSLVADPLFTNAAALDFSDMDPASPAITQLGFVPIPAGGVGPQGAPGGMSAARWAVQQWRQRQRRVAEQAGQRAA